ncbi:hypothetical protein STEG23_030772 [Scotinomys teguina]
MDISTAPVPSTEPPMDISTAPVPSTEPPMDISTAPVPSTEPPMDISTAPVPSTEPPMDISTGPVPSTEPSLFFQPTASTPTSPLTRNRDAAITESSLNHDNVVAFGLMLSHDSIWHQDEQKTSLCRRNGEDTTCREKAKEKCTLLRRPVPFHSYLPVASPTGDPQDPMELLLCSSVGSDRRVLIPAT